VPEQASLTIAEARDQLPRLVHDVEDGPPVTITRRGKPVAVVMSVPAYRRLLARQQPFWDALNSFRSEHDLTVLKDVDTLFDGLRDADPGRAVEL
jgi:prevent-host-death family protein